MEGGYQFGNEQILPKQRKPLMGIQNQKDVNMFYIYILRTANVVITELMKDNNQTMKSTSEIVLKPYLIN